MKKFSLFIVILITQILNVHCGIPSADSIQQLNTPAIKVGFKQYKSYNNYVYQYISKNYATVPYSIRIRILAYQPEADFSGFMIYINNSADVMPSENDDGTKASLQIAHTYHYYYDSSRGNYPRQAQIEGRFIVPSGTFNSGLYPSISVSALAGITAVSPLTEPVYPAITRYPVEFYFDIKWDGKGQNLVFGAEKKYNIAITAVDVASKLESKLSNIIMVRFNGVVGDGDFDFDSSI